jgi:hypothetical protein
MLKNGGVALPPLNSVGLSPNHCHVVSGPQSHGYMKKPNPKRMSSSRISLASNQLEQLNLSTFWQEFSIHNAIDVALTYQLKPSPLNMP